MKKWKNVVFACSLILNLVLIVGIVCLGYYFRITIAKLSLFNANFMIEQNERVISVLDSNEPSKVSRLKESLKMQNESHAQVAKGAKMLLNEK